MQLNLEQKKIIQAKPNGHMLIKGVAGSGKTTVAVNRIPYLLNHYCFAADDRILFVTYNKTLVNYIRYLYEKVDDTELSIFNPLFGNNTDRVEFETIDSIIYKYFMDYKKENMLKLNIADNNNEKYIVMQEAIAEISKNYENVSILDQKNTKFFIDEIEWIKSCNYMEPEEYQNADRLGRMTKQSAEGPQKLLKNSDVRKAIYELMLLYNSKLQSKGYIDFKDMGLYAYKQVLKRANKKYTHILIDESQDLTRVQLEILKQLYNEKDYSSFMFVCDTAQSIYPHSWLVKGRSFTSIGFDMTGKSSSLTKNYRTTTQIAEAAYSLIENDENIVDDENYVKPSLIDKQGSYPVYRCFRNQENEAEYIIKLIRNKLLDKYSKRDIIIIAKNKNLLNYIKGVMDKAKLDCVIISRNEDNFDGDSIKLLTMHSIKGLEFKVVIIAGLNKDIIPYNAYKNIEESSLIESGDKKLLYVGMTRANEMLYLTSSGVPSKFIGEINPKYLKLNTSSRFSKFYNIGIDDYEFKNDISDLYSEEEKVRQWILKELIDSYKYPKNLIQIEYKVNNFSKVGSVDAAVSIYNNGSRLPYIFAEVKAYGNGIEQAKRQLESYMSANAACQYGIASDGNDMVIINKSFEEIEDIPMFNPSMLPLSIESYRYADFRNNMELNMFVDCDDKSEMVVEVNSQKSIIKEEGLERIQVFSSIAAGQPIYISGETNGFFPFPKEYLKGKDNCFILKIRGDSMIGAGIDDGDYVVIQKQSTAQNRDIVAVSIDDSATLKRFMKMGDTILLIPENEKYEPIQLRSDQAEIIGNAIGVIKKVKQDF